MSTTIERLQAEIVDYFEECGIEVNGFDLFTFCEETGLEPETAHSLLCNMEHEEIQELIANGQYDQFDLNDPSQFNDAYWEILPDGDDEDEDGL